MSSSGGRQRERQLGGGSLAVSGDVDYTIPTLMEGTHVEMYGRDACRDVSGMCSLAQLEGTHVEMYEPYAPGSIK